MDASDLIANYPILYHMAAKGSWQSIRQHGLLSTSGLLDLYSIQGDERVAIEDRHRPESATISHPELGTVTIRDQKPMSDAGLQRALQDELSPTEWYRILNSKVFFWTNVDRLYRLLSARAYRADEHDVLWVNTESVVRAHATRIRLCSMNSGATKPFPHPRGRDTFLAISDYPWEDWVEKRGIDEAVGGVDFEGGIPDISRHVRRVVQMQT